MTVPDVEILGVVGLRDRVDVGDEVVPSCWQLFGLLESQISIVIY